MEELKDLQHKDSSLASCFAEAVDLVNEGEQLDLTKPNFVLDKGALYRVNRSRTKSPSDVESQRKQLVIPERYREMIMREAHEGTWGGHLGIRKTMSNILGKFCWPSIKKVFLALIQFYYLLILSSVFVLITDLSDIGIGAVLLQENGEKLFPIAYFSKKLGEAQKKYSTVEKETLALVLALKHFEVYATSGNVPLKVLTDHNPLKFLHRFSNKNRRLANWSLILQDFNFTIEHVKGRDNVTADFLSRNIH